MGIVTEKLEGSEEITGKGGVKFIIREFDMGDLEDVVRINRAVLPENYPSYFFVEHHLNFPKAFIVAKVNGETAGYVMSRVEFGWSNIKRGSIVRKGHIVSIGVLPQYRRIGIGYNLMVRSMRALKHFYRASEVYLEVRVSNKPAISLYEKLGYRVVDVVKGYYHDGEDAYIMATSLDNY
ncbi:MAG: ribosomal protein S18-alanine N-acetyltransferase [Caldivirga sp.]|jgi:ribosomal-protein-alanine N-acetyltransferase